MRQRTGGDQSIVSAFLHELGYAKAAYHGIRAPLTACTMHVWQRGVRQKTPVLTKVLLDRRRWTKDIHSDGLEMGRRGHGGGRIRRRRSARAGYAMQHKSVNRNSGGQVVCVVTAAAQVGNGRGNTRGFQHSGNTAVGFGGVAG